MQLAQQACSAGVCEPAALFPARRRRTLAAYFITRRYTRDRNRLMPATPSSCQSRSRSGGAANSAYMRVASAPYRATMSSGETTLPFDFDIFAPFLITIPCVNKRSAGSSFVISSGRASPSSRSENRSGEGWRVPLRRCIGRWETNTQPPLYQMEPCRSWRSV